MAHICGNNKLRKLVYTSIVLFSVLAVVFCIKAYTFIAFPLDVNEELCGMLTNATTRIILCKRSGGATVAFHYALYVNEIKPDNVVAIIRDSGVMPKLEYSDIEHIVVRIPDVNDIVYLEKCALVCDLHQRGTLIKMKAK